MRYGPAIIVTLRSTKVVADDHAKVQGKVYTGKFVSVNQKTNYQGRRTLKGVDGNRMSRTDRAQKF